MTEYEKMMMKLKLVELGQNQTMLTLNAMLVKTPIAIEMANVADDLLEIAANKANALLKEHE